jgi:hypothetical protein
MSLESFSRLSQSIVDAARATDTDATRKSAALVVNSIGSHNLHARPAIRPTQFDAAVDLVAKSIGTAKERKQTEVKKAETEKSLAELLSESAQAGE